MADTPISETASSPPFEILIPIAVRLAGEMGKLCDKPESMGWYEYIQEGLRGGEGLQPGHTVDGHPQG